MKNLILPFLFLSIFIQSCSVGNKENVASTEDFKLDEMVMPDAIMDEVSMNIIAKEKNGKDKEAHKPGTWKRSNKIANTVVLFVGDNEKLHLDATQIAVTVDGFRARVLMDCFFYNNKDFQAEGTFKMRLPNGASPYYFAFGESAYINKDKKEVPFVDYEQIDFSPEGIQNMRSENWKNPKEARIVEKEKAAFAYGNTVRRQVDPALAEWAGADVFNCRVFPLVQNKLHRIVIGYDVNLTEIENDWLFNFPIPDINSPLVVDFKVADIPRISSSIQPIQKIKKKDNYKTFQLINPQFEELSVRYSGLKNMAINSNSSEKEKYFASTIHPNIPSGNDNSVHDKAIIALDISLSSQPDKFNVWLKMTEALLKNNKDAIKEFNVLLFNVESFWWKNNSVQNTDQNINDFLTFARTLSLEGASDLGLALAEISKDKNAKNIFLLSDGNVTWGSSDHYELSNKMNNNDILFAYNTRMSGTSLNTLQHLCRNSGGAIFSIAGEDEINKASKAFRKTPWKIENIAINGTEDILIQGRPAFIYEGQHLFLTGRNTISKGTNIKLSLSQNGNKKDINIPINTTLSSNLTKRTYGQIATNSLEEFGYDTEKYSIPYAKHFNVAGKTCSFLMLDTEEDYKEYNINATEDAFVVKSTKASDIINKTIKEIGALLGNAKMNFKKWLDKLTKTPGVDFSIPTSLEMLVDKMPENKFVIDSKGLDCKSKTKNNVAKNIQDELNKNELDYDIINSAAEKRKTNYSKNDALKLLSSLVEKNPSDGVLARDVAFSALEWGLDEQAYHLFQRVLKSRPYEPQTYHAIAQALDKIGNKELAIIYYEIAIHAQWDPRFGEFKKIATLDYLNMLSKLNSNSTFSDYSSSRIENLKKEFKDIEMDLMVTISWNTDNTDIDLHIIEPTGEECFYSHPDTKIGGHMTKDVTQGYGPEMYTLKTAKKGKYTIRAKYYSSNRNRASARTKVYATIYENWGKKNEKVTKKVISLKDNKEMHDIGIISL